MLHGGPKGTGAWMAEQAGARLADSESAPLACCAMKMWYLAAAAAPEASCGLPAQFALENGSGDWRVDARFRINGMSISYPKHCAIAQILTVETGRRSGRGARGGSDLRSTLPEVWGDGLS